MAVRNASPGVDDAELRAVTTGWDSWGADWRQRDYDVLTSAEFRQALKDNGVKVVPGWTEAYTVEFSGSSGRGAYPLVLSYASSPASELGDSRSRPHRCNGGRARLHHG